MYHNIDLELKSINNYQVKGTVSSVRGLIIECIGISHFVAVGSRCRIIKLDKTELFAEVVAVNLETSKLMSYSDNSGVGIGCQVIVVDRNWVIYPDKSWKGRILNGLGDAIDNKSKLKKGDTGYPLNPLPLPLSERSIIEEKIDLGIRAINTFTTCFYGQRMGVFAGSGVGKSVLLSMIAKFADSDVKVIGLIGERGREVQEFLQIYLGEEGLKNSIVVVATSNESALMRKQAAYLVLSISEYFRDQGMKVLCMIDSITRFAFAQREIGLSAGESPITKGYTTSVFTELPKLLERAGMGPKCGSITGLFTVLVEGDDTEEPVADSMRSILDGHIVLERKIAERGRFPAINILRSVSRPMINLISNSESDLISKTKKIISTYTDMEDIIRLGIYKSGANPEVDTAIKYFPEIEKFLSQSPKERYSIEEGYKNLDIILKNKL